MPRDRLPIGALGTITTTRTQTGWLARARIRDTDGVVRQIKAAGPTRGKAETRLKARALDRIPPSAGGITAETRLRDAATRWVEQLEAGGQQRAQTIAGYRDTVERHITPALGALTLREVTASRVQSLINAVASSSGPTTAKQVRGRLRQIMDMCVRDDALSHNPVIATRPPRTVRAENRGMTVDEIQAVRDHVIAWGEVVTSGPRRNAPLLLDVLDVLAGTGARPGEVLGLRISEDVDLSVPALSISGTVTRVGGRLVRQPMPKSAAGERVLTLDPLTATVVRKRYLAAVDKAGPLFPSRTGGWIEPNNLGRMWRDARAGGFEHVTFRSYRKAVATILQEVAGLDAAKAQLGHASSATTERHYVERTRLVDFADAVGRLRRSS